jgi:hypothetical protein
MGMTKEVWFKIFKDFGVGLFVALAPMLMPGLSTGASVTISVGGIVIILMKVAAGVAANDIPKSSDFLKIIADFFAGFFVMAQAVLQNGLDGHAKVLYILAGLGICALSALANVLHDDWSTATGVMKIFKDCVIASIMAIVPILQAGLSNGTSLGLMLAGAGVVLLSAIGNVLEADIFGLSSKPATPQT